MNDPPGGRTLLPCTDLKSRRNSVQVNIPAESGEMGVLSQHVPSIEQLKPGLIEVIEEAGGSKQFFCRTTVNNHCNGGAGQLTFDIIASGGFAVVQPGSKLSINAVEAYPLKDFNLDVGSWLVAVFEKHMNTD